MTTNTESMTTAQLMEELARLKAENASLMSKKTLKGGLKVSEKGALSLYGLQRFPITLYKAQWMALLDKKEEILEYIRANDAALVNDKPVKPTAK